MSERATVMAAGGDQAAVQLHDGQQLTFGRDPSADVRLPDEGRLSRLAGAVRAFGDGVAITNLSATHDLYVRSDTGTGTVRLAPTAAGQPVASLLITGGISTITWPGAGPTTAVTVRVVSVPADLPTRPAAGSSTARPLTLNPITKEFAVALLLCRPRLEGVPGAVSTPAVPELTRQLLATMNSFWLMNQFDEDPTVRARLTARTHEHLRSLRDKIVRAGIAPEGAALSPEAIADLLVDENVLRHSHLDLLSNETWLTAQEREWEQ